MNEIQVKLLGSKLTMPKIAAVVLAVYGGCYAVILLIVVGSAVQMSVATLIVLALLALATTPFIALVHLNRATRMRDGPTARPGIMAAVMAVPAVFWLYATINALLPLQYLDRSDVMSIATLCAVPGLLALWLSMTFVLLAVKERANEQRNTAVESTDIE